MKTKEVKKMGNIFGPGGSRQFDNGSSFFSSGRTGDDITQNMGGTLFSSSRGMQYKSGDTLFQENSVINKVGGSYFSSNGKIYQRQGNDLVSSDGRRWTGISTMSEADIRNIILHDN